jgi:drug/metabolite transporter (DMT)-like permease
MALPARICARASRVTCGSRCPAVQFVRGVLARQNALPARSVADAQRLRRGPRRAETLAAVGMGRYPIMAGAAWAAALPRDHFMTRFSLRARLYAELALAIALDTVVQFLWKTAADRVPDDVSLLATAYAMLSQPIFLLIGALLFAQFINWLKVLELADLSYAKPITSLSYVTVGIVSMLFLGETLHPVQVAGIAIVIAGVWCITRTEHRSPTFERAR